MRMLVVASETLSPLSTAGPLPTDGQPEWCVCSGFADRHVRLPRLCSAGMADGPFPVTVGRWAEVVSCPGCDQRRESTGKFPDWEAHSRCDRAQSLVGAIVELLTVPGPSHHADECYRHVGGVDASGSPYMADSWCHPDAAPDSWHTPVASVEVLDVPILMERPHAQVDVQRLEDPEPWTIDGAPEPFWFADLDLEVPA